jgi:hypothetical protein
MNSTVTKVDLFSTANIIKMLLLTVFVSACALSIKAAYDLAKDSDVFPVWFVPSFISGIIILIALSLYFVFQAWKIEDHSHLLTSKQSVYLWAFMLLSFICTTSVHGFYPFRPDILSMLPILDSVLKINYVIAVTGFIASIALASIYIFSQMKLPAMVGLLIMALLTLIPNDNCSNPFNYWWIETIGASPLMYVPNVYITLFVTCGLYGIHPKGVAILTMCICLGSILLGIGHQLGIIW